MTEPASRQRLIASWVLRVLLGLAFLTIGAVKLTGSLRTVQLFERLGWGQWFRYMTGLLDVAGALLVLVPRWTYYGALLLTCTIGFATVLTFTRLLPGNLAAPLALTMLAATVAWLTRPRVKRAEGHYRD
jgi:uncharacterized membrane protein YphA (DoxX/SURF4 family)